jgi:hypothetical protein
MKAYIVKVDDDGTKRWYLDDKLHREDGPAVEYADGIKRWFLNDKLHREDGPAVEYTDGRAWYLNGVEYSEAEWHKQTQKVKSPCVGKVIEIDGVKYKLVEA